MLAPLLALSLGASSALAAGATGGEGHKAGSFEDGGSTLVSAMMLMLGNENTVYVLDKSEGNAAQINGHAAMGAVYDIASRTAQPIEVTTNPFCSSGMHMPNGSFISFGGNAAVGPGANVGDTGSGAFDTTYQDYAGQTGVRVINPLGCSAGNTSGDAACQWQESTATSHLKVQRWYSTAEARGDGSVVVIGGFSNGGYINRNYPVQPDPVYQGNASQPTYEFWPPRDEAPALMQFLVETGGLNSYPLTWLMASGKMFLQANVSSMLWDPDTNEETALPSMPDNIVRVYPASGAAAMLPLTPATNYTQTVLFCGGSDMPDDAWGNYSWPFINTWEYPASPKCHTITPEPADGSAPAYTEDDPMPEGRTMGQFILLPNGQVLVVNGGANGTAGYSTQTLLTTSYADMPYGESLASAPVGTPALYDPSAPKGSRWTNAGFDTSDIPRLYHSSALLLPDASVLIAGSNPNLDVNLSTVFPTTYKAEIWYPPYFASPQRPVPTGVPRNISYGGPSFDVGVPAAGYAGAANDAAGNASVWLMRPGFTTHGMNMGQRALRLNNTYTVNKDGSLTLHVAQAPPNPNLFQPGPALLFVSVNGVPSNGTYVIVGNGEVGTQPTAEAAKLPESVRLDNVSGTGTASNTTTTGSGNGTSGSGSKDQTSGAAGVQTRVGAVLGGVLAAVVVGLLG